jgi:hypothetical protein
MELLRGTYRGNFYNSHKLLGNFLELFGELFLNSLVTFEEKFCGGTI